MAERGAKNDHQMINADKRQITVFGCMSVKNAICVIEGTLTEKKWLFKKRSEEGVDVLTDELYNTWERVKERSSEPFPCDASHRAEAPASSTADVRVSHHQTPYLSKSG